MVNSICDSYPKFGAAAPRQTGVITRRKKWGAFNAPPPANAGLTRALLGLWISHRLLGGGGGAFERPPMISAPGRRR